MYYSFTPITKLCSIGFMSKSEEVLFRLLQCELWGNKFDQDVTSQEIEEVLKLAKAQTVFGLVFNALVTNQVKLDKKVLFKAIAIQNKIRQQNELLNQEMVDFFKQMDAHQIDYLVMKGQTLAVLYPHPEMRMSGDVDFLIKADYEKVRKSFDSLFAISLPTLNAYEKEAAFERNGVLYELHTYLITFGSSQNSKYWDQLIADCWAQRYYVDILDSKIRILPPTLYSVYVFLHLFFHLIREGVGLRQFCDWAVFLNHYAQEIDTNLLQEILVKLDMLPAYRAFGSIAVSLLGLPAERFPFELTEKDQKWVHKIMQDVLKGGNFGKQNHQAKGVGLKFKLETALVSIRNVFAYYPLAPRDLRNYLIRLVKGNIVLYFKKAFVR